MGSGQASINARKAVVDVFHSTMRDMWGEQWVRAAAFYLAVQLVTLLFARWWDCSHWGDWWTQVWITSVAALAVYMVILLWRAVPRGWAAWRLWRSQPFTDEVMRDAQALRTGAVKVIVAHDEAAWKEHAKLMNAWYFKASGIDWNVRALIHFYESKEMAPLVQLDWPGHEYTLKSVQRFDTWMAAVPWALAQRWRQVMAKEWSPPYASWYYVRRAPRRAWLVVTRPLRRLVWRKGAPPP